MGKEALNLIRKKNKGIYDWCTLVLGCIFAMQFIWISYESLFNIKYYLGYDNSMNLLYEVISAKSGELFVKDFECTTGQFCTVLESVIYKITGKVFLAYGAADIIHMVIILYFTYRIINIIIKEGEEKLFSFLVIGVLMLCPFVNKSNVWELNFANNMHYPVAYYISSVMLFVFIVWVYMFSQMDSKLPPKDIVIILLGCIVLVTKMVATYELIVINIIAPILLCIVINFVVRNDINYLKSRQAIWGYCLIAMTCVAVVGNKIFLTKSYSTASSIKWMSVFEFPQSILSVIGGFYNFASALPNTSDVDVLNIQAIEFISGFFIVSCFLIAFICVVRKLIMKYNQTETILPFVCVVVFNVVFYSIVDVDYSGTGFPPRYIIVSFVALFFIWAIFISNIDKNLIFRMMGCVAFIISVGVVTLFSDYYRVSSRVGTERLEAIKFIADETGNGAKLVYFIGAVNNDVRYSRVWDTDRVYKDIWANGELWHWGDYLYSDEAADDQGPYLIFCNKENTDTIPAYVFNKVEKIGEWDVYDVYAGENTVYDFETDYDQDLCYDFPYSPSVICNHLNMNEDGDFISDGEEDVIMYGMNHKFIKGKYDIELYYEIIEDGGNDIVGNFDIVKNEEEIPYSVEITKDYDTFKVGLYGVMVDGDSWLQYRVLENKGAIIKVDKIVLRKVE